MERTVRQAGVRWTSLYVLYVFMYYIRIYNIVWWNLRWVSAKPGLSRTRQRFDCPTSPLPTPKDKPFRCTPNRSEDTLYLYLSPLSPWPRSPPEKVNPKGVGPHQRWSAQVILSDPGTHFGPPSQHVPGTGPEVARNRQPRRVPAEPLSAAVLRPIRASLPAALRIHVEQGDLNRGLSSHQPLRSTPIVHNSSQ